jgi:hypothetical protein
MSRQQTPSRPAHQHGIARGEEAARHTGREPGQRSAGTTGAGRPATTTTPRFSTGINPNDRKPIDPKSPYLPPA